jgi:hypothetical protein
VTLAWVAALLGAVGYGVASVLQGVGSSRSSGPAVLGQPMYVAGLACDGLAWLASLVALRDLPLFVVQSVLAGSVGVTVVLAWLFLGARLRPRDAGAVVLMVLALAVLAVAFPAQSASFPAGLTGWALGALLLVALATGVLYRRGGSLPLAALAGAAFAGAAVAARAVDLGGGLGTVAGQPLVWAVLGFGAVGTLAYARSLERGAVGPATAVLWSVEAVLAGVAGVAVLGDAVRPGWAPVAVLAVLLTLLGCAVLATAPAERALHPTGA